MFQTERVTAKGRPRQAIQSMGQDARRGKLGDTRKTRATNLISRMHVRTTHRFDMPASMWPTARAREGGGMGCLTLAIHAASRRAEASAFRSRDAMHRLGWPCVLLLIGYQERSNSP